MAGESVAAWLTSLPQSSIGCGDKVVVIESSLDLPTAFNRLLEHNILSAPVLNVDAAKVEYTGFLDIRDLVGFLTVMGHHLDRGNFLIHDVVAAGSGSAVENITVTYLSRRNPFRSVLPTANLWEVAQMLCTVKRVPVVDATGRVVNLISQSDLVKLFSQHMDRFSAALRASSMSTVAPSPIKRVLTICETETALKAFELMDSKQITGLAIVNADGKIVGNVTGKDTRAFVRKPTYEMLHMPILQMVKELRNAVDVDERVPAMFVNGADLFTKVLQKIVATKVHRLYVCNQDDVPIGVISLSDVLRWTVV